MSDDKLGKLARVVSHLAFIGMFVAVLLRFWYYEQISDAVVWALGWIVISLRDAQFTVCERFRGEL